MKKMEKKNSSTSMKKDHQNHHNHYRPLWHFVSVLVLLIILIREISTVMMINKTSSSIMSSSNSIGLSASMSTMSTMQKLTMLATSTSASTSTSPKRDYVPSKIEKYIIDNRKELGYDPKDKKSNPTGCNIWDSSTIPPINNDKNGDGDDSSTKNMFHDYSFHLDRHIKAVKDFQPIPNLLKSIIDNNNNNNNSSSSSSSIEEICSAARYVTCLRLRLRMRLFVLNNGCVALLLALDVWERDIPPSHMTTVIYLRTVKTPTRSIDRLIFLFLF